MTPPEYRLSVCGWGAGPRTWRPDLSVIVPAVTVGAALDILDLSPRLIGLILGRARRLSLAVRFRSGLLNREAQLRDPLIMIAPCLAGRFVRRVQATLERVAFLLDSHKGAHQVQHRRVRLGPGDDPLDLDLALGIRRPLSGLVGGGVSRPSTLIRCACGLLMGLILGVLGVGCLPGGELCAGVRGSEKELLQALRD